MIASPAGVCNVMHAEVAAKTAFGFRGSFGESIFFSEFDFLLFKRNKTRFRKAVLVCIFF